MWLILLAVASTLVAKSGADNVRAQYRHRKTRYIAHSRRRHPRWSPRRRVTAAHWAASAYTAMEVLHGFPSLRRGVREGWHAHRAARAEGRVRHTRDIAEYRRRYNAARSQAFFDQVRARRAGSGDADRRGENAGQGDVPGVPGTSHRRVSPAQEPDVAGTTRDTQAPGGGYAPRRGGHRPDGRAERKENDQMSEMTGEVTGYEGVLATTEEYKQRAQQERDQAAAQRAEAAAMRQAAENLVDGMSAHEVDAETVAEAAELQEAADAAEASATAREQAADRLFAAAETLARGLQQRHGGLAEAHKSAPVPAALRGFYED